MITESIRRFILTSIDSIPHLEAILLLRYDQEMEWDDKTVAQTLYISEKKASTILDDLCASHLVNCSCRNSNIDRSIIVQGLTIEPLLRKLKLQNQES